RFDHQVARFEDLTAQIFKGDAIFFREPSEAPWVIRCQRAERRRRPFLMGLQGLCGLSVLPWLCRVGDGLEAAGGAGATTDAPPAGFCLAGSDLFFYVGDRRDGRANCEQRAVSAFWRKRGLLL